MVANEAPGYKIRLKWNSHGLMYDPIEHDGFSSLPSLLQGAPGQLLQHVGNTACCAIISKRGEQRWPSG